MIEWIAQWILARRTPEKVMYIGGSDILPPPLEKGREQTAIEGLSRGDETAKQLLIEHNLRLVVYISRR